MSWQGDWNAALIMRENKDGTLLSIKRAFAHSCALVSIICHRSGYGKLTLVLIY